MGGALRLAGAPQFEENKRDGHGVDWPIRYDDIRPWYDHVEEFIGVSGQTEYDSPFAPVGRFQPGMLMNACETFVADSIRQKFPDRRLTIAPSAVLTRPLHGRAPCHYCGPCERGCSTARTSARSGRRCLPQRRRAISRSSLTAWWLGSTTIRSHARSLAFVHRSKHPRWASVTPRGCSSTHPLWDPRRSCSTQRGKFPQWHRQSQWLLGQYPDGSRIFTVSAVIPGMLDSTR